MWKPALNFITLHYAWIIFNSLLALVIVYPYGNLAAIDAYFFGASASTESGLNTVDVKDLKTYQQLYIYFIPIITNLGFVNIIVVAVRLFWFEKRFKAAATSFPKPSASSGPATDIEAQQEAALDRLNPEDGLNRPRGQGEENTPPVAEEARTDKQDTPGLAASTPHITFGEDVREPRSNSTYLYVPPPRDRDNGHAIVEKDTVASDDDDEDEDAIKPATDSAPGRSGLTKRRGYRQRDDGGAGPSLSHTKSIEHAAASLFILGSTNVTSPEQDRRRRSASRPRSADLPYLSREATVGRNSQFYNLTAQDRERLGGIEYRALKLLLKIASGYFFGLHLFGVLCLVPWIHRAPSKYTDWLQQNGQDKTWWAFYSAQTMVNNLGFTLTPDSMVTFRDATWPMLVLTFLAFAGETFYPVFLRLVIWTLSKLVPRHSSTQESLRFLLDHPRRCYMLLFPSRPTWILFGILVALNAVDVLLIIVLDLDNPAVNDLPLGPRILSALFQAASARHTGTATLNLAAVNPAVQFSLVVMMYISIFPIAISIRASNTYEERALGLYRDEVRSLDERDGKSYVVTHIRNQLSFDLWYIFLGTFCICVAEAKRIAIVEDPAFSVFSVMFEVVSAYANVGLSLGHPTVMTSLSGQFTTFSKVVICAMMIRGRHRGLPYAMDRAVILPGDEEGEGKGGKTDGAEAAGPPGANGDDDGKASRAPGLLKKTG